MSTLQFFVEPAITNDIFIARLKEIGKALSQGFHVAEPFPSLGNAKISDIVLSSKHLAVLLEDGRVCRIGYAISQDFAESVVQTQDKRNLVAVESHKQSESSGDGQPPSKRLAGSGSNNSHESGISLTRQRLGNASSVAATSVSRLASAISNNSSSSGRNRAMAASLVALGSRGLPPLPASMVPEALVQQVQTVLSGSKSRQLIIRELQRTHLDVNLAVNNLLSRDSDGEGDDDDDDLGDASSDPAEVVRLLDAAAASASGLVEHLLMDDDEDVQFVSRASAHDAHVRRAAAAAAFFDSSTTADDNYSASGCAHSSKLPPMSPTDAIVFDKEITPWLCSDGTPVLFSAIASMHSDLVAIDKHGHLQAWPWMDAKPPPYSNDNHGHPRARSLGLSGTDKVILLACAASRASLMTDSNRIATWIDSSIRQQPTAILEHCAMLFPQLSSLQIQNISVSDTHTAVLTSAGSIYWWGALPYRMRHSNSQANSGCRAGNNREQESGFSLEAAKASIIPGATVRLRTSPLVSCGALALGVPSSALPGVEVSPRLAELLEDAWNPTSSYRFKLLPASGTTSSTLPTSLLTKRKRTSVIHNSTDTNISPINSEEVCWPLADVILLNDGPSPPLGRVVKVDGEYAAVRFNNGNGNSGSNGNNSPMTQSDIETLLADCRLLRLSELEVVCGASLVSTSSAKRERSAGAAFSVQVTPRRLDSLAEPGSILGWLITADSPTPAVHILSRRSDGLYYRTVPLSVDTAPKKTKKKSSNKHDSSLPGQVVQVPISLSLLIEQNTTFKLIAPSPANSTVMFAINQHNCIFPLSRPAVPSVISPSFCEPPFLRLGPIAAFAGGLTLNPRASSSSTGCHQMPFFVSLMAFQLPLLSTCIQRRDLDGVRKVLRYFERNDISENFSTFIESERFDGERNILHQAVQACAPLVASSPSFNSSSQRRASFDELAEFDMSSFDGSSSSRHRVTARRLTLRQMIREASSAAAVNPSGSASGRINSVAPTSSASSLSQTWQVLDPRSGSNPSSATVTVGTVVEDSSSNGVETFGDLVQCLANPYTYAPSSTSSGNSSGSEDMRRVSLQTTSEVILSELLKSKAVAPCLPKLLSSLDGNSRTPFMAAVLNRAYSAAIQLLNAIITMVVEQTGIKLEEQNGQQNFRFLESYIFPTKHCNADDNPFHLLCYNDTCSFTWTGAEHINQDIYECRSCGLVGSLCCCSECARICHRGPGHDCRLKRTSPTAYCDCWEKCGCRGLIAGNQSDRLALAKEIAKLTPQLVLLPTAAALGRPPESILSFLLRTLQRQQLEQRQYRGPPSRSGSMRSRSGGNSHYRSAQPDAVDPPRFVRQVLNFLLDDSSLLGNIFNCLGDSAVSPFVPVKGQAPYVCELDRVAFLVLKCASDVHDRFSRAIVELDQRGASEAVGSFIRSTVRAYCAIAASLPPNMALPTRSSSGGCCVAALPLRGCRQLLASVPLIAIRELASAASAVIKPVTLGLCRGPSGSYNLISPMMTTTSVPEAVDAAETMLIGSPAVVNEGGSQSSSGESQHRQPSNAEGHLTRFQPRLPPGIFMSARRVMEHDASDSESSLDDDFDDEFGDGPSSDGGDNHMDSFGFVHVDHYSGSIPEQSLDDHIPSSGARSPSPSAVENYVDAEEDISNSQNASQANDLPPPLLPSVGPSSSASSISGAPSSSMAPSVSFAFVEPAAHQDATDEQQDETISLIRSAAATVGSEAGGTSIISFASENEDDTETLSAVSSAVRSANGNTQSNQSSTNQGNRFSRRRLPSSSPSSSSSNTNSSDEADVIRVMVAGDIDDGLLERDALGGHGMVGVVDDVSTDSSIVSAPRPISSIVNRSTAPLQPPPPPPLPPPPPPPALGSQAGEPFRYHAQDIVLFGTDMSPQQPSSARSSGRFAQAPIIDMSEMPLRTQSPTLFHSASGNGSQSSGANMAGPSGAHAGGSNLSPHFNEMFQAANQQHLTRLFSILVRFAADLLSSLAVNQSTNQTGSSFLNIKSSQSISISAPSLRNLQDDVDTILEPALRWIIAAVDSIEAQLRSRAGYPEIINGNQRMNETGGNTNRDPISSARLSFGHHALNLIRDPHGLLPNPDFLPALRHAIDSLLSLIRACAPVNSGILGESSSSSGARGLMRSSNRLLGYVEVSDDSDDSLHSSNTSQLSSPTIGRSSVDQFGAQRSNNLFGGVTYSAPPPLTSWPVARMDQASSIVSSVMTTVDANHPFFKRSTSLTAVGWEAPPVFSTPAEEALPLAIRPDLLNSQSRRHELFGLRRQAGVTTSGLMAEFPADPFTNIVPAVAVLGDSVSESEITNGRGLRHPRVAGSLLTEPLLAARWALVLNWVASLRSDGQNSEIQYASGGNGGDFGNVGNASDPLLNFGRFLSSASFGGDAAGFGVLPPWPTNNSSSYNQISPVTELVGGYALVERRFRSDMERLRNSQQREIVMADLERNPSSNLLACVTRQLQFAFSRRTGSTSSSTSRPWQPHQSSTGCPPLLCHKLKVSFLHEPGEGAGVARSLFTTFAEVVTSDDCKLPLAQLRALIGGDHQRSSSLSSNVQPGPSSSGGGSSGSGLSALMPPHAHGHQSSSIRNQRSSNIFSHLIPAFFSVPISRGGASGSSTRDWDRILRDAVAVSLLGARSSNLSTAQQDQAAANEQAQSGISQIPEFTPNHPEMQARFPSHKLRFGVRLLSRISIIEPRLAGRIVYVLLHLTPNQLLQLLTSDSKLREVVAETAMLINETMSAAPPATVSIEEPRTKTDGNGTAPAPNTEQDNAPLFYRLSNGHLAPRVGLGSMERLVALRCVGRVIGLSLLHAELCPFLLARHVIKYIIGKTPFCFLDLAFLDPVAFESLRRIAHDVTTLPHDEAEKLFEAIDLTAVVDLVPEEGGGRVELVLPATGNAQVVEMSDQSGGNPITPQNALAFVLAYSELRLIHAAQPALDALRAGVLDVLPAHVLESLTPEDVSLLLCGTGTRITAEPISQQKVVERLRALTTIQNESGRDADMVRRFKGWFWAEVSRLARKSCDQPPASSGASTSAGNPASNAMADLLSFWTGASALPATDAALVATPPSLVVRPPDDMHLPTANTCISRLYVPLYSSRLILRKKLAIAIRTKMFGFV